MNKFIDKIPDSWLLSIAALCFTIFWAGFAQIYLIGVLGFSEIQAYGVIIIFIILRKKE